MSEEAGTRSMTPKDFKVGERVAHIAIGDGTVSAANSRTVYVIYDKHSRGRPIIGIYDHQWFRLHPKFLFHRSRSGDALHPTQQPPHAGDGK